MRIWTATITLRINANGDPKFSVDVDVEAGAEAFIPMIGDQIEGLGRKMASDIADDTVIKEPRR